MAASTRASALWRWGPAVAYALLIFYASSKPGLNPPFNIWDKLAHAIEFGILAALVWRAIGGSFFAAASLPRAAAYLLCCAVYGVLDEIHQAFVPGREASFLDAAADFTGACAVVLALLAVSSLRGMRSGRMGTPADASPSLTLLSKPGCHLCDEAEAIILKLRAEIPFEYKRVDVSSNADLSSMYGLELPVVLMGGRKIFKYRVDVDELRRRLLRAQGEVA